jgi:DNA-binding response OmpR family regulator
MSKGKILLVEDDAFLSELYVTKFEEVGYEITVAEDGQEGLELVGKVRPDIVLLDIVLPRMDGLTALRSMKEREGIKDIPVILLTNLGQKEDVDRGIALGAADYVIKAHFTPTEVVAKVDEVLKKRVRS